MRRGTIDMRGGPGRDWAETQSRLPSRRVVPEAVNELATQTVLGAASIVQSTGQHPALLRDMVTSPGGRMAPVQAGVSEKLGMKIIEISE